MTNEGRSSAAYQICNNQLCTRLIIVEMTTGPNVMLEHSGGMRTRPAFQT